MDEWCRDVVNVLASPADRERVRASARDTVFAALQRDNVVVPAPGEPTVLLGVSFTPRFTDLVGALHDGFGYEPAGDRRVLEVPVTMTGWVFGLYARHARFAPALPVRVIAVPTPCPSNWQLVAELAAGTSWEEAAKVAALFEPADC
jgi:hypothetical protein